MTESSALEEAMNATAANQGNTSISISTQNTLTLTGRMLPRSSGSQFRQAFNWVGLQQRSSAAGRPGF